MIVCCSDWLLTSANTCINTQYPVDLSVKSSAACCLEGSPVPWDWGFYGFNIRRKLFTIHLSILMYDWKCRIKLLYTLISQPPTLLTSNGHWGLEPLQVSINADRNYNCHIQSLHLLSVSETAWLQSRFIWKEHALQRNTWYPYDLTVFWWLLAQLLLHSEYRLQYSIGKCIYSLQMTEYRRSERELTGGVARRKQNPSTITPLQTAPWIYQ